MSGGHHADEAGGQAPEAGAASLSVVVSGAPEPAATGDAWIVGRQGGRWMGRSPDAPAARGRERGGMQPTAPSPLAAAAKRSQPWRLAPDDGRRGHRVAR